MKKTKSKNDKTLSQVVVLSVIFGFMAGIVGQIISDVYINPFDYYQTQAINTNQSIIETKIPELKRVKRFLGIEQDFQVSESINQINPSLAGVYVKKSESSNVLNQVYLPSQLKGSAFILTSDGWLVTTQATINGLDESGMVIVYDNQIFEVDKIIKDSITDIVFVKVTSDNLPVVVLGDSDEINLGQLVIVLNSLDQSLISNIKNIEYNSTDTLVMSSDSFVDKVLLQDGLPYEFIGSPVINLGGEVIGIVSLVNSDGQALVTPLNQFRMIILEVLKSNLVKRPYLGVEYLDLSKVSGIDKDITLGLNSGALIYQNPEALSPAADIELQKNDIIISIDGQVIDQFNNLTEVIQQYQVGNEIEIEFIRDGKQFVKKVTLSLLLE